MSVTLFTGDPGMKKMLIVLFCASMIFLISGNANAAVVWSDGMSSLASWTEDSDAVPEEGDSVGGIQVITGGRVQMNSWWDGAGWTSMWRSTTVTIQDQFDYTIIVRMISYDGGDTVPFAMWDVDTDLDIITASPPSVSTSTFTDYSVSFTTAGTINDGLIGHQLGVAIRPGWWNNLAVTTVSIDAEAAVVNDTTSPSPDPMIWDTVPFAKNAASISMNAARATDDLNNVEYFFECTTDPNFNSSWQSYATYACYGLTTGSEYTFKVKARDTSINYNETGWSSSESAAPVAISVDYPAILAGAGGDLATASASELTVTIDLNDQKQKIEGFGASDCWSGQYVGQWPSIKREAIADLLFETDVDGSNNPIGAGLSIWRMNVGAGSVRQNNIYDHWRRSDFYYNASLTAYDWTRCQGQRNLLQLAKARGVEHFKAFCNSPPITMTKNGYAFCDTGVGDTNLDPAKRDEFATYLVDLLEHFRDVEGIDFKTISPFNEPEWDWDEDPGNPGYAWQEGSRYSNAEMKEFVNVLYTEMQSRGLESHIDVCDSGQIDYIYSQGSFKGNHAYEFFDISSSNYIGDKIPASISSHSYWTDSDSFGLVNQRQSLRNELDSYGLAFEQTEYCILGGYGPTRDLGIDPALYIARTIHFDMTIAQATTWQWWLGISPYDYKDGLVYCDKNDVDGNYYESKMLWSVGNYARFIRPGMRQVGLTRSDGAAPADTIESLMVSSYYNLLNDVVVTVFVNRDSSNKPVQLNYLNLPSAKPIDFIVPYVTSALRDLIAYSALTVDDTIRIPARSVVTIVSMHAASGDLEPDGDVDIDDVRIMASQWQQTGAGLTADIAPEPVDEIVNFKDFVELAKSWACCFIP